MIGFLEILDLRDEVEAALGDAFDLAAFHALILENGSLPVGILRGIVENHIERALASPQEA